MLPPSRLDPEWARAPIQKPACCLSRDEAVDTRVQARIQDFCQGRAPRQWWPHMRWEWAIFDIRKHRFATFQDVDCHIMPEWCWTTIQETPVSLLSALETRKLVPSARVLPSQGWAPAPAPPWIRAWSLRSWVNWWPLRSGQWPKIDQNATSPITSYLSKLETRFKDQNVPYGLRNTVRCLLGPYGPFWGSKFKKIFFRKNVNFSLVNFMTPMTPFRYMNDKRMPNSKSAHQINPGCTKTRKMTWRHQRSFIYLFIHCVSLWHPIHDWLLSHSVIQIVRPQYKTRKNTCR